MIIPWRNIVKIGEDVILVRVNEPKGSVILPLLVKAGNLNVSGTFIYLIFQSAAKRMLKIVLK